MRRSLLLALAATSLLPACTLSSAGMPGVHDSLPEHIRSNIAHAPLGVEKWRSVLDQCKRWWSGCSISFAEVEAHPYTVLL
jgi:hypothetical protein